MNGIVYIVQRNNNLDYKDAERFGRASILYERDAFPDNADERTEQMTYIARSKLREFNPDTDYLLLSGDPIAISIVVLVLGEKHNNIPVLKWDKENRAYFPVYLNPKQHNFNKKEPENFNYNR